MRWYMDTEFHEDGRIIDLISIGLISEDGTSYYAVSTEFDPETRNDWVKANVLPKLPDRDGPDGFRWQSRAKIAANVRMLLLGGLDEKPEVWGYFADYDWVVLCQLYGRMVDLPKGFPMWCRDLKQLMQDRGIEKDQLPPQPENAHDALADARWVRAAHLHILGQPTK